MPLLHDPIVQAALLERIDRLAPDATPQWGRMSVDQMLWHINQGLLQALGRIELDGGRSPVPRAVIRFAVLNLPWMKGAPTNQRLIARGQHDFAAEQAACRALVTEFVGRSLDSLDSVHPSFGRMRGRDHSRLHAKHLDHHLRQFGV